MNNKEKKLKKRRLSTLLIISCMGIGFAALSTTFLFSGSTFVKGNKWSTKFQNFEVLDGSVTASQYVSQSRIELYNITLNYPGQYYQFQVDIVNDGNIDVKINNVNIYGLNEENSDYVNYTVTYLDGSELKEGDVLYSQTKKRINVLLEYSNDITPEMLNNMSGDIWLDYVRFYVSYVRTEERQDSNFVTLVKSNALSDEEIDFTEVSSSSNGRGLYLKEDTKKYRYPIYYYRGAVENNNAKFAGFCWKIVRTTDSGGTKLLYNGLPDGSGHCDNTGVNSQLATTSVFNTSDNSPAYNGYMYGIGYANTTTEASNTYLYGSSYTYSNGVYTLDNTESYADSTYRYTCFNATGECENLSYIYYLDGTDAYSITLTNGKSIETALTEMNTNTNASVIKTAVDTWFNDTFKTYFTTNELDYEDYLEDTRWCNDRSFNQEENSDFTSNGWLVDGSIDYHLYYSSYGRVSTGVPKLECSNKEDIFTVSDLNMGNKKLTYPVGLLTADEIVLAGGQLSQVASEDTDFYLNTNTPWWSMSPNNFSNEANEYIVTDGTGIGSSKVSIANGVRPSISLKKEVTIASGGDGTSSNPYEFEVE